ncbi:heme lyase CcmF/NrfE family subunit [Vibrio palustris]|uniref:Cytochrome c-type biogenesis protein CcmF n=1 Tax=Vibrio palustris TaxID=1918946 RepID=A0A1R4B0J5_9VIBR|nr:heme lyase CcmF/NrfE family subunit [Vibrio palustris]SJL82407.1 Cytochrome c-type biogenesis protein CcmF [Vibrio palustris]
MIPELGHFALILAAVMAVLLSTLPLLGTRNQSHTLISTARPLSFGMAAFISFAFFALAWAFYHNDFTLEYVAHNSNSQLPWYYRLTAVWGAHEGSLLLWIWIQSLWTVAVAIGSRNLPEEAVARVLAVMGMISVGFLAFIIFTSDPFTRTLPYFPVDGQDLNPLLQDPGLIIHPPMLYTGYVGFSVAFAFAIAALMTGKLDTVWARWSRPWTTAAWMFLTVGIVLGSWWAYYELGWGGWWFWDPVENASLMPWIAGTALLHSLAVSEKRGTFKAWTVLLAIIAFSLSLLGTFLVRSGILVSVHSFASDPTRGTFILSLLVIVIGGSLTLFALKGHKIRSAGQFNLISRESALLTNNILLMAGLSTVLLGTLLPLVHKQLGLGSVSIGAPFFNSMFAWLAIPFTLLLGVSPLLRWKRGNWKPLLWPMIGSALIALICAYGAVTVLGEHFSIMAYIGWFMALWIVVLHAYEVYLRATHRHAFFIGVWKIQRSHWSMLVAHLGLAVSIIGISMAQNYSIEKDVRLEPGQTFQLLDYQFRFEGLKALNGPNYQGYEGAFSVSRDGKVLNTLFAQKRQYTVSNSMMTEAALDTGLTRDLYIALGEPIDNTQAWAVRIYYKPFIRWIWGGGLLMAFGGLLVLTDRRYRFKRQGATA